MEVNEVIEERLFANDDNDELELQYLGFQLFTSLKADLCQDIKGGNSNLLDKICYLME